MANFGHTVPLVHLQPQLVAQKVVTEVCRCARAVVSKILYLERRNIILHLLWLNYIVLYMNKKTLLICMGLCWFVLQGLFTCSLPQNQKDWGKGNTTKHNRWRHLDEGIRYRSLFSKILTLQNRPWLRPRHGRNSHELSLCTGRVEQLEQHVQQLEDKGIIDNVFFRCFALLCICYNISWAGSGQTCVNTK